MLREFFKDFRAFIRRGNVIDLAVAVIMGGAFGQMVTTLVNDVIMPPIGLSLGKVDFSNLYINLSKKHYPSLAAAKAAGAPIIQYGLFLNTVVNFLIVSLVIFIAIRQLSRLKKPEPVKAPNTKICRFCRSEIPLDPHFAPVFWACVHFRQEF
ncbi:large conductance mechanosensitive channel protein MscL [Alicyclobacillus acidocaldarius]|uniref:Large-conductance mechanosensitive channel n=1 Tax=Alicyclobacillus acidocaldarius (strain Tc-4-1) TaxID=1048834 RepID=F8IIF1_ALIAT|nr:large conductance mechanosensitive channel protein MscL [Alicyclobacillus acidocaldarius]AEJ42110.1 large conductance mechanosensitive channel protein [Alicyclobacillus acidocaldarius subsp. acidocaldarius Tc-4-1]